MSTKQASLQMSLQFLSEVVFFFPPIALHGIVLMDLTASTFHVSFREGAFPFPKYTGINSHVSELAFLSLGALVMSRKSGYTWAVLQTSCVNPMCQEKLVKWE